MKNFKLFFIIPLIPFMNGSLGNFFRASAQTPVLASLQEPLQGEIEWFTQSIPFLPMLRGHEIITKYSVEMANMHLETKLPAVVLSKSGILSSSPIIKGNVATDYPDKNILSYYGFRGGFMAWQDAPDLQFVHFLRNYRDGVVDSFENSCKQSRISMINIAKKAVIERENGNYEAFLFWSGHALHTLQDSFSPAHTVRDGKKLLDICTYGEVFTGSCYHHSPFSSHIEDDNVWKLSRRCLLHHKNRDYSCLKAEAQNAVKASAGYLITLANSTSATVENNMLENFTNSTSEFSGYLSCEKEASH